MDKSFNQIINEAKSIVSSLPCSYSEIRLSSSTGTSIVLSGEQVDSFTAGDSLCGSVRILNNGAWGFVSFNDLDDIKAFARKGLSISSQIKAKEKSEVLPSGPVVNKFRTEAVKDFKSIPIDEKYNLIKSYNNILNSSSFVQTTRASYRDIHSLHAFINSEGSEIVYDSSYCGISLSSVAKDGSVIQPFQNSISGYGGYEIAENREGMAEDVLKTAVDLLKAESVSGGVYKVIIDPKLAGVFIHEAFGHLSEADFIHENEQMKKMMVLGKRFGIDELNVIDNGNIDGLTGYIPVDDEGVLPEKTYLIRDGILEGRLHSRETAFRMNEKLTGNGRAISVMKQPIVRMTNTYIENGRNTREEIFDSVDNGIYAVDFIGGQTNLEMFTFTSGYGYDIKKGKPGKMYKDIVLSGNVFNTLLNIEMTANDRQMFGGGCGKGGQSPLPVSFGGPHLFIKDVLIGGKQ